MPKYVALPTNNKNVKHRIFTSYGMAKNYLKENSANGNIYSYPNYADVHKMELDQLELFGEHEGSYKVPKVRS